MSKKVFVGSFINPINFGNVEFIEFGLCLISLDSGLIEEFKKFASSQQLETYLNTLDPSIAVHFMGKDEFMSPGFVDMHTHAPQYRNLALGLDYTLLEWLDKVTFAEEKSFSKQPDESDSEYRSRVSTIYGHMVNHYLKCGTTTCCYFGGLQLDANKILVDEIKAKGQRALVGKVCMDCNSPQGYVESEEESIQHTEDFINYIRTIDNNDNRIYPVVTPRFALTCSSKSLHQMGKVAKRYDCHIQSHISENLDEARVAAVLFPDSKDYADIYRSHGLLTEKTIMAHAVHVDDNSRECLAKYGVGVAHCPNSNFALNSGVADVRSMIQAGIKVGLGTDVSGGYSPSIIDAMRQAIIASKVKHIQDQSSKPLTIQEAFTMATIEGAKALNLQGQIGNFLVGKKFDALIIDMKSCPSIRNPNEGLVHHLQRFVFQGDDRWIKSVFISGILVA